MIRDKKTNIASEYAKIETSVNEGLKKLTEEYAALGNRPLSASIIPFRASKVKTELNDMKQNAPALSCRGAVHFTLFSDSDNQKSTSVS